MDHAQDLGNQKRGEDDLKQAQYLVVGCHSTGHEDLGVESQGHGDRGQAEEEDGDRKDAAGAFWIDIDIYHALDGSREGGGSALLTVLLDPLPSATA